MKTQLIFCLVLLAVNLAWSLPVVTTTPVPTTVTPVPVATSSPSANIISYCVTGTDILTESEGSLGCSTYGNNAAYQFEILSDEIGQILLEFTSFNLEYAYDYLYVYDGASTDDPLLGTFTGSTLPEDIEATSNSLTLMLVTDSSVTSGYYFTAEYQTINTNACLEDGATEVYQVDAPAGTIGCADGYADDLDLTWIIDTNSQDNIQLDFTLLDLESCCDSVTIYDGDSVNSPLLGTYTGSTLPTDVITSTFHAITIHFETDGSVAYSGFQIEYETIISEESACVEADSDVEFYLNSNTGTFGCSDGYANNLNITWVIEVEEGYSISLELSNFYTEGNYDYVRVYDGDNVDSTLLGSYSGSYTDIEIESSGSSLTVEFTTDGSNSYDGFTGEYTASLTEANACATDDSTASFYLTNNQGTIGCADGYADDLDLTWFISTDTDRQIELDFTLLYLESCCDSVSIYDGDSTASPLIGTYTGTNIPANVYSTNNTITVNFDTDGSVAYSGFQINYSSYVSESNACFISGVYNYNITDNSGSFGCADGYADDVDIDWLLTTLEDTDTIQLDFTSFYTESSYDYVRVYDGNSTSEPLIGSYSGSYSPFSIVSTSNQLYVTFSSDGSNTYDGFSATFSSIVAADVACVTEGADNQYTLTEIEGTIGCPNGYADDVTIEWNIISDVAGQIEFDFIELDLESCCDSVSLYDGDSIYSPLIGSYTGSDASAYSSVLSTSNTLTAVFTSDGSVDYTGFQASYSTIINECLSAGSTSTTYLNAESGSFGCASGYSDDLDLTWVISPLYATETITIDFDSFVTESYYDTVSVYDGPNTSYPLIGSYSGSLSPFSVTSSFDYLTVVFHTDASNTYDGFSATFTSNSSTTTIPSE